MKVGEAVEQSPLLVEVLPSLAKQIKHYFTNDISRFELGRQVDTLRIKTLCDCGEPDCGSFYLTTYEEDRDIEEFNLDGIGTIETQNGLITFIEIFPSPEGNHIRNTLKNNGVLY
ncbi:hypothetical protein ANABIO32_08360 [Rossellomorea marisflavi]|uniref:hypothetical protein n=1 Tax=Rossellomorea marisflavi TaxID=189381 RepID=UPI0020793364|nr:hypothetical protein [Rossellomorea marisflavi]USK93052.1 hypothetical protein LIT29_04690 [Rossellomorea marisflavi]GLI83146.1 hypothetical protein ANABIO32_08360 [Rossellomorea marisflavi]